MGMRARDVWLESGRSDAIRCPEFPPGIQAHGAGSLEPCDCGHHLLARGLALLNPACGQSYPLWRGIWAEDQGRDLERHPEVVGRQWPDIAPEFGNGSGAHSRAL